MARRPSAARLTIVTVLLAQLALDGFVAPLQAQTLRQADLDQEHKMRKDRLTALANSRLRTTPQFYETLVSRSDLPPEYGVDIPVLRVVFQQRAFFETDSDALRPDAREVIRAVAEALKQERNDTAVFVAGHADSRGTDKYNLDLSAMRADTVARALEGTKIAQAKIWRIGFGKAIPLVPNTNDESMAKNRRVEFLFARKVEAVAAVLSGQESLICKDAPAEVQETCRAALNRLPRVDAVKISHGDTSTVQLEPLTTGTIAVQVQPLARVKLPTLTPFGVDLRQPPVFVGRPER